MKRRGVFYATLTLLAQDAPKDRMPKWFRAYLETLSQARKDELAAYFSGDTCMGPVRDIYEILGSGR